MWPLAQLSSKYVLVSARKAHAGHVHLYVRQGLDAELVDGLQGPGVACLLSVAGRRLAVAAVHLPAAEISSAEQRREKLRALVAGLPRPRDALLVLGDLNVREE